MLVASADAGVEAGGVDCQRYLALLVFIDLELSIETLEVSLDGEEAPEVRNPKLGAGR